MKKNHFLLLCFMLILNIVLIHAQVGINTLSPESSSVIDITSTSKGMLIPRMSKLERDAIEKPQNGLLVFDTDFNMFFYYYSVVGQNDNTGAKALGCWVALNPWVFAAPNNAIELKDRNIYSLLPGNVGIGTDSPSVKLEVNGHIKAVEYDINATGAGPIPKGGIIMWNGTHIPHGYALCDGTNDTPNLKDKFIYGTDTIHVNETGGSFTHNHIIDTAGHIHTLSGTTGTIANNVKEFPRVEYTTSNYSGDTRTITGAPLWGTQDAYVLGKNIGKRLPYIQTELCAPGEEKCLEGIHVHELDTNSKIGNRGIHNHSGFTINIPSDVNSNNYLPPYYKLAYIMKL